QFTSEDITLTIPHACCSHIMKDFRIMARLCKINEMQIKRIMFYSSVLLNSFTYQQLKQNYFLFCGYFLLSNESTQWWTTTDALTTAVKSLSKSNMEETTDIVMDDKFFDMTPADDEYDVSQLDTNVPDIFKTKKQSTQFSTWISNEENILNSIESSIKSDMVKIFENVCRSADKYELVTTKSTKLKKKSADNESQLSPYEKFIVQFNKLYMGTVHMWSNILLGEKTKARNK
ncbi:unnamed protein product, partial [Didymodactylos carnosus]